MVRCVLALLLTVMVCACGTGAETAAQVDDQIPPPAWLTSVTPSPGSELEIQDRIELRYSAASDESVRLSIDGTDVTDDAQISAGALILDPRQPPVQVELDPGSHTAVAERVRTQDDTPADPAIDSYTWTFEVP